MQCQINTSSPIHVSIVKCLNMSTTDQVTYHLHTRASGHNPHIAHYILSVGGKLELLEVCSCLIAEQFNSIRLVHTQ